MLFADAVLMVVSKPQGMSVHPAPGCRHGTLVQQVRQAFSDAGSPQRHVAPVSRLDRGTSGLVLLATDRAAHPSLHRQVIGRQIRRDYVCLVWGQPLFEETVVDLPTGRHWLDSRREAVYDLPPLHAARYGARRARTHLRVLERFEETALLSARLETGRMHQIRVHCQFARHPVVGDPVYGPRRGKHWLIARPSEAPVRLSLEWQCLHAGQLRFRHPLTGDEMLFAAPAPPPFSTLVEALRAGAAAPDHSEPDSGVPAP